MHQPIRLSDLFEIRRQILDPRLYPNESFLSYSLPAFDANRSPEIRRGSQIDSAKFVVAPNTILISKLNPRIRRVWRVLRTNPQAICSTEFVNLVPQAPALAEFLFHLLSSDIIYKILECKAEGTTNSHVRFKAALLKSIQIVEAPPRATWGRIAEILSTLDETIEQTEALIAKYQQIKTGLMHDLFTRGLTPAGRLRPTRVEAPHLYKQTSLGWIPNEWNVTTIGAVSTQIEQGWSPDCEPECVGQGQWGVLKTSAVTWSGFDIGENKRLPSQLFPRRELKVERGQLLMTRAGPSSRVGVVTCVDVDPGNLMLSDKLYRIVPNIEFCPRFLCLALSSAASQRVLDTYKTGLADSQTNISQEIVRKLRICLPQKEERQMFSRRMDSLQTGLGITLEQCSKLRQLKLGLMQDLLTGRVRVPIPELTTA